MLLGFIINVDNSLNNSNRWLKLLRLTTTANVVVVGDFMKLPLAVRFGFNPLTSPNRTAYSPTVYTPAIIEDLSVDTDYVAVVYCYRV